MKTKKKEKQFISLILIFYYASILLKEKGKTNLPNFVLLVLVALVVCAAAQWPYYGGYYAGYNGYVAPPAAYNYYGAYNPALSYLWKKYN
ncbi:UNVERIFIED_CONTAM: hypothetical protein NCL1_58383 [Trichonephila clavipes]